MEWVRPDLPVPRDRRVYKDSPAQKVRLAPPDRKVSKVPRVLRVPKA